MGDAIPTRIKLSACALCYFLAGVCTDEALLTLTATGTGVAANSNGGNPCCCCGYAAQCSDQCACRPAAQADAATNENQSQRQKRGVPIFTPACGDDLPTTALLSGNPGPQHPTTEAAVIPIVLYSRFLPLILRSPPVVVCDPFDKVPIA